MEPGRATSRGRRSRPSRASPTSATRSSRGGASSPTRSTLERCRASSAVLERRLTALAREAAAIAAGMDFRFLLRRVPQALLDRVPGVRRPARPGVLRPARLGSAARELHCDRAGRRPFRALVPPRPAAQPASGRLGPRVVGRYDVRVPDAGPLCCTCPPDAAGAESPAVVARQIAYGEERGCAVGSLGVGVQRAGPRGRLPVFELRRARARLEAGAHRGYVVAPYATALAAPGRSRPGCANFQRAHRRGGRGIYGFYEARLHASRLPGGRRSPSCKAYMAHHQGMTSSRWRTRCSPS